MDALLAIVLEFFEGDNWPVQMVSEVGLAQTQFQGDNGNWVCQVRASAEIGQVVFYSICPVKAPSAKLATLAEFVARANYGLIMGNFELDFESGEIRFKTSIDVDGATLTQILIKNVVYANVFLLDKYLPGIMKAIYSDTPPAQLIEEIEAK